MTLKFYKGEGIEWITKSSKEVAKWYEGVKGTKNRSSAYLENAAQNYLLNHLDKLRSEKFKSFWVEDVLMDKDKENLQRKFRADVIVEYEDEIWVIEVKGQDTDLTWLFQNSPKGKLRKWTAVWQVDYYCKRVKNLEWWARKKIRRVIFWCYPEELEKNKRIPKDFDFEETSKWPIERESF